MPVPKPGNLAVNAVQVQEGCHAFSSVGTIGPARGSGFWGAQRVVFLLTIFWDPLNTHI